MRADHTTQSNMLRAARSVRMVFALTVALLCCAPAYADDAAPIEREQSPPLQALTADDVAARAVANSFVVDAALESLHAAQAGVQAARRGFLPDLRSLARVTRVSRPPAPTGPSTLSVVTVPTGTSGPIFPTPSPGTTAAGDSTQLVALPVDLSYLPRQTQTSLQASLSVPVSDYLTRIAPLRRAAGESETSARGALKSARARSAADARTCYYEWLRAIAARQVAEQAVADGQLHANDVRDHMRAGLANQADLLQAETALLEAELRLESVRSDVVLSEAVVRSALRIGEDERIVPAEQLEHAPEAPDREEAELVQQALRTRGELTSAHASARVRRELARVELSPALPTLSLSGNLYYANPPLRQVRQSNEWAFAWDVGVQLSWSITDVARATSAAAEQSARARSLRASADQLALTISLETRRAAESLRARIRSVELAQRMLDSAEKGLAAARDLFSNNEAEAQTVLLCEQDLIRARSARLDALADAWIARTNLDRALGRVDGAAQGAR